MKCKFRPSKHAKEQMIMRGISKEEVLNCILKGAKRLYGRKIVSRFGKIEVVFIKKPCQYFVITAYWR